MSPTEHDLRNALRHGEGDGVDVDGLIAGARARRQQRRVRIGATAAVVALVAAAATGTALLTGNGKHHDTTAAASQNRAAGQTAGRAAGAAGGTAAPSVQHGIASTLPCPASLPRQLLPGGGSPGQFGSGGPLFAQPVNTLVVCAYGARPSTPTPNRLILTGARAQQLVDSLENAAKTRTPTCPVERTGPSRDYALIGVTAGGGTLRTVTVELAVPPCQSKITNGTAVRYSWDPPLSLSIALTRLGLPLPLRSVGPPK